MEAQPAPVMPPPINGIHALSKQQKEEVKQVAKYEASPALQSFMQMFMSLFDPQKLTSNIDQCLHL